MTNTSRNTLVLSALLVLLSGFGVGVYRDLSKKATELKAENQKTSKKIEILEKQISNIDSLKMEYEIRKAMVAEQSKVILTTDNPTITYRYLLTMLSWMKRNIIFDFALSDKGEADASWNEYILSGRSSYRDVVELTKNLEQQRVVLTIEDLAISSEGLAHSDSVAFSLVIRTHFNASGIAAEEVQAKKIPRTMSFFQLFKARIYDTQKEDHDADPRLVRIDQASLIGIAANRIFLRDGQGVIKILTLRDKVAYGYLYGIDVAKGKATFMIDKYGIPEEQSIFITTTK